jgi:hypothetical protein
MTTKKSQIRSDLRNANLGTDRGRTLLKRARSKTSAQDDLSLLINMEPLSLAIKPMPRGPN